MLNYTKAQLEQLGIEWVELRSSQGFKRFKHVLEKLKIPYKDIVENNVHKQIDQILDEIFT